MLSQTYEINDHSKAHYAYHPNPPCYFLANPRISNPHMEGPQNEYSYMPEKHKPNNKRFKVLFINKDNKCELINKRKGDEDYKDGHDLQREVKVGLKEKF